MSDYQLMQEVGLQMGDPMYVDDLGYAVRAPVRAPQYSPYYGGMPRPPMAPGGQQLPYRRLVPQVPGAPAIGLRLQPMGLGNVIFTATSGVSLPVSSRPQRPFKGKRLVVSVARSGATATGLITVTSLDIGTNNQFVSAAPIGADAFAPGAFDTNLELAACSTALDITVVFATSLAPTAPDTIAVNATLIGEAIG